MIQHHFQLLLSDLLQMENDKLRLENDMDRLVYPEIDNVGDWFIGFGSSYLYGQKVTPFTDPITLREALTFAKSVLIDTLIQAEEFLPGFHDHSVTRQHVIVLMIYQLGLGRFARFEKTILALMNLDYDEASYQIIDSKAYREQTPRRFACLAERVMTDEWISVDEWRNGSRALPAPIKMNAIQGIK